LSLLDQKSTNRPIPIATLYLARCEKLFAASFEK
jgi:hypothetical protein